MQSFTNVHPLLFHLILALRIRPPVPANLQREVPDGGMMIAGQYVPAGVYTAFSLADSRLW